MNAEPRGFQHLIKVIGACIEPSSFLEPQRNLAGQRFFGHSLVLSSTRDSAAMAILSRLFLKEWKLQCGMLTSGMRTELCLYFWAVCEKSCKLPVPKRGAPAFRELALPVHPAMIWRSKGALHFWSYPCGT